MVTAYENVVANWFQNTEAKPTLNGTSYPAFNRWVTAMLLNWSRNDPVSVKETARNNAVYEWQQNRNPFIDFPGIEEYVWGNKQNKIFSTQPNSADFATGENIKIYSSDGFLIIENCAEKEMIYVYDYTGILIKTEIANSDFVKIVINQPHRFLIVKTGNKVVKLTINNYESI